MSSGGENKKQNSFVDSPRINFGEAEQTVEESNILNGNPNYTMPINIEYLIPARMELLCTPEQLQKRSDRLQNDITEDIDKKQQIISSCYMRPLKCEYVLSHIIFAEPSEHTLKTVSTEHSTESTSSKGAKTIDTVLQSAVEEQNSKSTCTSKPCIRKFPETLVYKKCCACGEYLKHQKMCTKSLPSISIETSSNNEKSCKKNSNSMVDRHVEESIDSCQKNQSNSSFVNSGNENLMEQDNVCTVIMSKQSQNEVSKVFSPKLCQYYNGSNPIIKENNLGSLSYSLGSKQDNKSKEEGIGSQSTSSHVSQNMLLEESLLELNQNNYDSISCSDVNSSTQNTEFLMSSLSYSSVPNKYKNLDQNIRLNELLSDFRQCCNNESMEYQNSLCSILSKKSHIASLIINEDKANITELESVSSNITNMRTVSSSRNTITENAMHDLEKFEHSVSNVEPFNVCQTDRSVIVQNALINHASVNISNTPFKPYHSALDNVNNITNITSKP